MMRFGKSLPPLDADVEYIPSAHGTSSKKFKKDYEEAEDE
jgi:hypothetical protein